MTHVYRTGARRGGEVQKAKSCRRSHSEPVKSDLDHQVEKLSEASMFSFSIYERSSVSPFQATHTSCAANAISLELAVSAHSLRCSHPRRKFVLFLQFPTLGWSVQSASPLWLFMFSYLFVARQHYVN